MKALNMMLTIKMMMTTMLMIVMMMKTNVIVMMKVMIKYIAVYFTRRLKIQTTIKSCRDRETDLQVVVILLVDFLISIEIQFGQLMEVPHFLWNNNQEINFYMGRI